jgi:hypothetical protein
MLGDGQAFRFIVLWNIADPNLRERNGPNGCDASRGRNRPQLS